MSDTHKRRQTVIDRFDPLGIDALLVSDETNVRYLSGFTGDSSYLLIQPSGTTILSDGRFTTQIAIDCPQLQTAIRPPSQALHDLVGSVIADSGARRVGIELNHLSLAMYRKLTAACGSVQWIETTDVVETSRQIKDEIEISRTREAVEIAERALEAVLASLSPTDTEREMAYRIEAEMRRRGATGCSFPPIVAGGSAAALPHYHPDQAAIGETGILLIDWGAQHKGYTSDLTRTYSLATVGTGGDKYRRAYAAVLEAQLAAIERIAPGVSAAAVDAAARGVLERHGMGEAFLHSLGHGIGLQIHESPRIASSSEQTLQSGMIVTVEPGVYFAGEFGIRIEDDVLVTDGGCELLSRLPKGLDDCRLML
jgi:Xaa-Pro aminopeptidase